MPDADNSAKLRRTIVTLALAVGLLAAILPPLVFAYFEYQRIDAEDRLENEITAIELSKLAYRQRNLWFYQDHMLLNVFERTLRADRPVHASIRDAGGEVRFRHDVHLDYPRIAHRTPIRLDNRNIAVLETERSLDGFATPVLAIATFSSLAGILIFAGMYWIPLGTLKRAFAALDASNRKLSEQVAETSRSYALLQHRHAEIAAAERRAEDARKEAEAANRAKSEFLANMSHDLRTPLNAIVGFAQLLTHQVAGPIGHPRYLGYAQDIFSSGEHLRDIINEILDLSRIEADNTPLTTELVEVHSLAMETCHLMRERAEAAGLTLVHGPPPAAAAAVIGDATKLKQVLLNLLSNAIKFTPPGGRVSVSTDGDGACVVLRVSDTGIGMKPQDVAKVGERFWRAEGSATRKYAGTGLGMAIVKALVERHGGSLAIDSEPGRGTTVTVSLPAASPAAGSAAHGPSAERLVH